MMTLRKKSWLHQKNPVFFLLSFLIDPRDSEGFCACFFFVCVCGKTGRRDAFWRSPVPLLPPALLGFPIFLYLSLCSSLRTHPYQVVSFCHLSFCLLSWFSHCFLLRKRFVFVGKRRLFYYFSLSFFRFLPISSSSDLFILFLAFFGSIFTRLLTFSFSFLF